jgi:hypothetical protein
MQAAPANLACKKLCILRTQATSGQPDNRHSLRNGLRLIRVLLGAPGFWPPSPRVRHARLDPGIGGSGPHDFAVRTWRIRLPRQSVHRNPRYVRDDRDTPLIGAGCGEMTIIFRKPEAEYFCGTGLT